MCVCLAGVPGPSVGRVSGLRQPISVLRALSHKTHGTGKKKKKSEFAETSLLFPNGWTPDETDHLPVFPAERQTLLVPKKNNMEPHTFSWRKPSGYKHTAGSQ